MPEAKIVPIATGRCGWAMTDKNGDLYPHDTKAYYRVEGAGEDYDGNFCTRHTAETALYALNEERRERDGLSARRI